MKRLLLTLMLLVCAVSATYASRFGWGVELEAAIDASGHDMSNLGFDAYFGYSHGVLDMAGVGVGAHMMMGNSCRTFPIYGVLRTSFRAEPSLCFLDLRAGVALDDVKYGSKQTAPYISPAMGFNLARSSKFRSYITLGYVYNGMRSFGPEDDYTRIPGGVHLVQVRLGVTF